MYSRAPLLLSLIYLLTACTTFPIGPKRAFNNWEELTPTIAATATTLPTLTMAALPPSLPLPDPSPTPSELSEPSEPAEPIEYAFPSPQPFTLGQTPTEFGIQINGCDKDVPAALAVAKRMGLTWIKQQARWADIETGPDRFDWACLDRVIPVAHAAGFKVLISVTSAPAHTRSIYRSAGTGVFNETSGRPMDFRDYGRFVAQMLLRYPKQIQAVEIFNEPNLMREWGDAMDGAVYAQLLAVGYGAVKAIDPSIMVISAGLGPTQLNQQWYAVDDAEFLRRLFAYDGLQNADCIGAHANGPDGVGEIQLVGPRYFDLAARSRPVCFTEFGYALPVDGRAPEGFGWIMSHTPERQAEVLLGGMRWARQSGFVRLVILWNLNFDGPAGDANVPYALVREGWESLVIAVMRQE